MKVFEILNESAFHSDTTEMPFYDNMMQNPEYFEREKGLKSKLVMMKPDVYINAVSKAKNVSVEQLRGGRETSQIEQYADQMKNNGRKFPILTLDYSRGYLSQEGLHRSFAAKIAGIQEVPVLIVDLTDEEKEWQNSRK